MHEAREHLAGIFAPGDLEFVDSGSPSVPAELAELTALCRLRLGRSLRALCLFGSHLRPRKPDAPMQPRSARGVPDLLAILDEGALDPWLRRQGHGRLLRAASRHLAPLTLALRVAGETRAKLNLIEPSALAGALARLPDLYLAGRLSKALQPLHIRDAACARELSETARQASEQIAHQVLLGLPRCCDLSTAIRACVAISYRAELRPEGPRKIDALLSAHHALYSARFGSLLRALAPARGFAFDPGTETLLDLRSPLRRAADRAKLRWLIFRSRLRSLVRWPKQMLAYRGWLRYLLSKLVRARSDERKP